MQKTNGPGDKKNQGARPGCAGSIGAYMRDKRISRDIGTEEVSAATGISTTVLQALENDDRENLPAEVYIKAFYKKYAEYLGLDFAEVQAKYQQQAQSLKKTRRRFDFNTVVTLKGHGGSIFTETLRRLFLPMAMPRTMEGDSAQRLASMVLYQIRGQVITMCNVSTATPRMAPM